MVARRGAAPGRGHREALLRDDVPRDHRPPSPKTISTFVYLAVLAIAIILAYVAVRSLFN